MNSRPGARPPAAIITKKAPKPTTSPSPATLTVGSERQRQAVLIFLAEYSAQRDKQLIEALNSLWQARCQQLAQEVASRVWAAAKRDEPSIVKIEGLSELVAAIVNKPAAPMEIKISNPDKVLTIKRDGDGKMTGAAVVGV
jgi:hypothetical protein